MNVKFVMPLYFKDLRDATQDFSDEEFGAYLRLLIHQWSSGSIPSDLSRISRIAHSAEKNWEIIKGKFSPSSETTLQNKRMEEIREETIHHQQSKAEAGKIGAKVRWQNNGKAYGKHYNKHNGNHLTKGIVTKKKNKEEDIDKEGSESFSL